jgi:hypothetical protein
MKSYKKSLVSSVATAALAFGMASASPAFGQEGDEQGFVQNTNEAEAKIDDQQVELTKTFTTVSPNPLVPVPVIGALGGATLLLCLFAAARREKGAWLRAGLTAALTIGLVNPEILEEEREILPTEVVVVVDKTSSQSINNRNDTTGKMYEELLAQLSEVDGINVRTVEVSDVRDDMNDDGTNLFSAVDMDLIDVPKDRLGAVIMLTDGQVHDVPLNDNIIGNGTPLHVLLSGREGEYDRRIVIEEAPRFGLVDNEQIIRFRVVDDGIAVNADGQARVSAIVDGVEIASQFVTPGEMAEMNVSIDHPGENIISLEVETVDGEITDVNNRIATSIEGVRESLNVLLLGDPNSGTRMWRDLLKSDPGADLIHFMIMRPPEKQDNTPLKELSIIPVPTHEIFSEKLEEFDLIVMDQYEYRGLLPRAYFNNIANYVNNGGSLMVVAGENYSKNSSIYSTPLSSILPAKPTGRTIDVAYKPEISDAGKKHPVTRNILNGYISGNDSENPEWGRWTRLIDSKVEDGNIIMEGAQGSPLLVLKREGEGRVATLLSDSAWLWARDYEGGGPYSDLLQQVSQWLLANPSLEEEDLRLIKKDGQLIIEQQTLSDSATAITIRKPSGEAVTVVPEEVEPGIWRSTIEADEVGLYSAEQSGEKLQTAFINVGPANPKEFVNVISTSEQLKPLVEEVKGLIARMNNGETGNIEVPDIVKLDSGADNEAAAGDNWLGVRMSNASILKGIERTPLVPPWLSLLVMVGLLAGACYREGDNKVFRKNLGLGNKPADGPANDGPSI